MLIRISLHCLAQAWHRVGPRGLLFALATAIIPAVLHANPIDPPLISARAAVIMDAVTGEILFAKALHQRLPPASTTKVLTTLIALERLDLNAKIRVSPSAADTVPSRIGLQAGESVSVQDLLYGMMLKSGNDASEVIAEAIGGSIAGFARLMNDRAWQLEARNSHFNNPHGLPDDSHHSTAYDLALIFRHAMRNPLFAEIVQTRHASLRIESTGGPGDWRTVPVRNSNQLLGSYEGARGGKTGYTIKARRCFVGEASRGQIRLIVAVLGSINPWPDVEQLFEYGFAHLNLATPTTIVASPPTQTLSTN